VVRGTFHARMIKPGAIGLGFTDGNVSGCDTRIDFQSEGVAGSQALPAV
jgi:hypothetical protein